jgi:heterodisulfide reductase subunit A-like polyferredoxin
VCFSCTDRRILCQGYLGDNAALDFGRNVEFVNIREQCAWSHSDDPAAATRKAIDIISSGIARARAPLPSPHEGYSVAGSALVLGTGLPGLAAARNLAAHGYPVAVIAGPERDGGNGQQSAECLEAREALLKELEAHGMNIRSWPRALQLNGSPGDYEAVVKYASETNRIGAGALILNLGGLEGELPPEAGGIPEESLLGRILARRGGCRAVGGEDSAALREFTIRETSGIFAVSSEAEEAPEEQVLKGAAAAARALAYMHQGFASPRTAAVSIDSALCRGCGDCAAICPYIELRARKSGLACAYVDPSLCLGCGACIASCPTGAISQPQQSEGDLTSTLEALLGKVPSAAGAR